MIALLTSANDREATYTLWNERGGYTRLDPMTTAQRHSVDGEVLATFHGSSGDVGPEAAADARHVACLVALANGNRAP